MSNYARFGKSLPKTLEEPARRIRIDQWQTVTIGKQTAPEPSVFSAKRPMFLIAVCYYQNR